MNTETGINAAFVPNFDIIRDPQPIDPVITQEDLVQVFDLVGLNINGYVDGKPYYGNVYYVNGIRYAGTSAQTSGTNIIVYDTQLASLQKRLDVVQPVSTVSVAEEPVTETETRGYYRGSISSPTRGSYSTTPTSAPSTTPTTSTPSTTPASGGTYSAPATPTPAPSSTPSTPAPSTPSPSSGGGGGGYGGGY